MAKELRKAYEQGKAHAIIVAAEGAEYNAKKLTEYFAENRDRLGFSIRTTTLGHVQRGGAPGAYDRILASRLGRGAVEAIDRGEFGVLVGQNGNNIITTPYEMIEGKTKTLDPKVIELARLLD